jgi:(S)-ureidoglycine aminohydrolase
LAKAITASRVRHGGEHFFYQPGTALPFVETHIMEHGLLMLAGAGIYRLGADWYPVQAGDVIWMAPYCP